MMTVDLHSALCRAPLLRYMSRCIVKRNVFSADRKDPMLSDGSRRWSGSRLQTIGPATENARHPNLLRRWRGTISWWRVADRRCWRLAMTDVGMQQSIGYCGDMPCKHRWTITPNLYWTRWGTSNQCSSEWSRHDKPRSNFRMPVTTWAAAFITRWSPVSKVLRYAPRVTRGFYLPSMHGTIPAFPLQLVDLGDFQI